MLLDPIKFGIEALVVGAMSVILGAGASFDATVAPLGFVTLFLITIGCADSLEVLLAATVVVVIDAFDESPDTSLLG